MQVSRAFRTRSLLVHPDKHKNSEEAKDAFKFLGEASKALRDEKGRAPLFRDKAQEAFAKRMKENPSELAAEAKLLSKARMKQIFICNAFV